MLRFRALALICGALLAGCGVLPQEATPTPKVVAPAETPAPPSSPVSPPSVSRLLDATPAPATAIANSSAAARADCPVGSATYRDVAAYLSLCAPPELRGSTDVDNIGAPGLLVTADDAQGLPIPGVLRVLVAARVTPRKMFGDTTPLAEICKRGGLPDLVSTAETSLTIAGQTARGCDTVGQAHDPDGPVELLQLSVPLPVSAGAPQLYLNMDVSWRVQMSGAKELAQQIMQSIRIQK